MSETDELVVLLDDAGQPIGTAAKRLVHHAATPLHLAFSCWIVDDERRTLLTRRAEGKQTFPGMWTNTVCGHPAPDESVERAVRRRARDELGLSLGDLDLALPDFRYRAVMTDGTVENEVCPVFVATTADDPVLEPSEASAVRWVPLDELTALVEADPTAYSPWMILQLPLLLDLPIVGGTAGG